MRFTLKDYQARATDSLLKELRKATREAAEDPDSHSAISLSAPTGAGKTVIASAVIETLFDGAPGFPEDPLATILWVTDDPALNEQTRRKMLQAADSLTPGRLITIDASYDEESFAPRHVYFLNIQKLMRTSRLARSNVEQRTFSLWQTIANTIRGNGAHFYVVVDEAHRGMTETDRSSIVSRIIGGEPGVSPAAPIIWGISATPKRFNDAMARSTVSRTSRPVLVPVDDVRASGLLKDLVILDNPAQSQTEGDTTLARAGVVQTLEFEAAWAAYAMAQDEPHVLPVLVVQVHNSPSEAELSDLLDAIYGAWPGLNDTNVVNTFADHSSLNIAGHVVRYMVPQDIQDDNDVRVVLCKDAISTGWDCPRAEVLVSLRRAEDYTYIAQLIGRMVRTPLARRILTDQTLNTVNCFLPRFNKKQVQDIVDRFKTGENDEPPVAATADPVYVARNDALPEELFALVNSLPSYVIPGKVYRTQVARLLSLATMLSGDGIVEGAIEKARAGLLGVLDMQRALLSGDGTLQASVTRIRSLKIERSYAFLAAESLDDLPEAESYEMSLDDNNVEDLFRVARRKLPEGVAGAFWSGILDGQGADDYDPTEAKAIVAAIALRPECVEAVESAAEQQVRTWLREHQRSIAALRDARRELYDPIKREARNVELTSISLPEARIENHQDQQWPLHLLADVDGNFPTNLNPWEERVLSAELADDKLVGWYRNPAGGDRALRVPYPAIPFEKPMYPDFILFHSSEDGVRPSIVDPHGYHLADALPKLRGLAAYAETHQDVFARIEAVVQGPDKRLLSLDLKSAAVRDAIRIHRDESALPLFMQYGGSYT